MNELRIICTDCDREYKNIQSGVYVKELFQKNTMVYRVWIADKMAGPECHRVTVARFADKPIAEHWEKERMDAVLRECEKKTLQKDLFEWKEYVKKEPELVITKQGKPEDA
jgi:hypothetical protein